MENIKFIAKITEYVPTKQNRERKVIGNCIYFVLKGKNRVKCSCGENCVHLEVINSTTGKVDSVELPFRNYFEPVRCSEGSPLWYQHIERDKWYCQEIAGARVLPKASDYKRLAEAIDDYMAMFE